MTPVDAARLRATLTARRAELAQRLETIHAHARDPLDRDSGEQAAQIGNVEVVAALESEAAAEIAAIDGALDRLHRGVYGDCVTCGEPIEPERLAARPAAAQCLECAERSPAR